MAFERNPTDRFLTFEDYYQSLPAYGQTGQGWPIQLWKKKNNGELTPLTLHANHVGENGNARLAYDFDPGKTVIIAKYNFGYSHDYNPGLSKVYYYLTFNGTARTVDSETWGPNPFEIKRGQTVYMWNYLNSVDGDTSYWRMVYPKQYPGFLNNLNNGTDATQGYNAAADYFAEHGWTFNTVTTASPGKDFLQSLGLTDNAAKWIAIIVAIAVALMLLIKLVF